MAASRWRLDAIDLGPCRADPAAVFGRLVSSGGGRGVLIERDDAEDRRAYLAAAPVEILRARSGRLWAFGRGRPRAVAGDPFSALGRRLRAWPALGAPPFSTGAAGWLGYEMARHLERLPLPCPGEEAVVMVFESWLVLDRLSARARWYALSGDAAGRRRGRAAAERAAALLAAAPDAAPVEAPVIDDLRPLEGRLGRRGFGAGVRRLKERIRAGDIFQAVLSDRFEVPTRASAGQVYAALRRVSPSPYLFWLADGPGHLIGASPERLVRVVGGRALNCPIAGTRPRSADRRRDRALERALKRSPKERAEHFMLVDLARNDLGRVCAPGSVRVRELMSVRRFPNVMHLVSEVEGRLGAGRSAWDALAAAFPAGTVSGAPKVRAMELLSGLERRERGFYAGALIQADFAGNLDSCLSIRTLRLADGRAVLQAGAGIVADSDPGREYDEVQRKILGLRAALAEAEAAA